MLFKERTFSIEKEKEILCSGFVHLAYELVLLLLEIRKFTITVNLCENVQWDSMPNEMFLIGVLQTRQSFQMRSLKKKKCTLLANFWVALDCVSCVLYFLCDFHIGFSVCVPILTFAATFHPRGGYISGEGRCTSSSLASF